MPPSSFLPSLTYRSQIFSGYSLLPFRKLPIDYSLSFLHLESFLVYQVFLQQFIMLEKKTLIKEKKFLSKEKQFSLILVVNFLLHYSFIYRKCLTVSCLPSLVHKPYSLPTTYLPWLPKAPTPTLLPTPGICKSPNPVHSVFLPDLSSIGQLTTPSFWKPLPLTSGFYTLMMILPCQPFPLDLSHFPLPSF